jgi:Ca-activated chloride channel family protein
MAQAKYLLREIFKAFPHNRFGIVPFAGSAFLSCPLTADHTALNEALEDLSTESVPVGGTNIEKALQTAQKAFAGAEGSHRAVILFTDGDELSGNASAAVAGLKKEHIPVAVAGFGDPAVAAPVPDGAGGVMRGADGKPAGSKLNENALRQLATETGGIYVRSLVDRTGFAELG